MGGCVERCMVSILGVGEVCRSIHRSIDILDNVCMYVCIGQFIWGCLEGDER